MTFLPIVERELRVAARAVGTYRLRFFSALALLCIWLAGAWGGHGRTPAELAKEQFNILGILALIFSLTAGIFLTADSLSSERREGTLGLLFLTELRSYDVLLGKLAATSLRSVYALLGALPVLALPLLMGGVTIGEFWRMSLVLVTTMFFSLAAGMAVSSANRETRQAMAGTFGTILMFTALPAIQEMVILFHGARRHASLLWPCPFYALAMVGEGSYRGGRSGEYWGSLLTLLGLGLAGLLVAVINLPRAWGDEERLGPAGGEAGKWHRWRFGVGAGRSLNRTRQLELNPYFWLALRDRLGRFAARGLVVASVPIWIMLMVGLLTVSRFFKMGVFQFALLATMSVQFIFKFMVAAEAGRRLSDDRESGALELLLISPMPVQQIVAGQRRALFDQFKEAAAAVLLLHGVLLFYYYSAVGRGGMTADRSTALVLVGNMAALVADFLALVWWGMWTGLRMRHHRAVLLTLVQILAPSWLFLLLLVATGFLTGSSWNVEFGIFLWFGFGIALDFFLVLGAKNRLGSQFRARAAGTFDRARPAQAGLKRLEIARP